VPQLRRDERLQLMLAVKNDASIQRAEMLQVRAKMLQVICPAVINAASGRCLFAATKMGAQAPAL
jgi:hypothetical protein